MLFEISPLEECMKAMASSSTSLEMGKLLFKYKPFGISEHNLNGDLGNLVEHHLQNKAAKWIELIYSLQRGPEVLNVNNIPKNIFARGGEPSLEFKRLRDTLLDQAWLTLNQKTAENWLNNPDKLWHLLDEIFKIPAREIEQISLSVPLIPGRNAKDCISAGNFNQISKYFSGANFERYIRSPKERVVHEIVAVNLGSRLTVKAAKRARSLLNLGPTYLNHLTGVCEHEWLSLGKFKFLADLDSLLVTENAALIPCFVRKTNSLILIRESSLLPAETWIIGKPREKADPPPSTLILKRVK